MINIRFLPFTLDTDVSKETSMIEFSNSESFPVLFILLLALKLKLFTTRKSKGLS